jgi:hypothetical protein
MKTINLRTKVIDTGIGIQPDDLHKTISGSLVA